MSASLNDSKTTLIGAEHDAKSISKDVQEEDRNAPALDLDKEVRINLDALASLPQPIGLDPFRCLSEPTLLSINKAPCWKVVSAPLFSYYDRIDTRASSPSGTWRRGGRFSSARASSTSGLRRVSPDVPSLENVAFGQVSFTR
jgi:hypothetical protein